MCSFSTVFPLHNIEALACMKWSQLMYEESENEMNERRELTQIWVKLKIIVWYFIRSCIFCTFTTRTRIILHCEVKN